VLPEQSKEKRRGRDASAAMRNRVQYGATKAALSSQHGDSKFERRIEDTRRRPGGGGRGRGRVIWMDRRSGPDLDEEGRKETTHAGVEKSRAERRA